MFDEITGAGSGLRAEDAELAALAEALERYSSSAWTDDQIRLATAAELGEEALDLATLPRCSATELADGRCPVRDPRADVPIRWVRGLSLMRGAPRWIPLALTHLYVDPHEGEDFTIQISTGCAAHTDPHLAVVNGLCEAIERDAISIVWQQRLPLTPLALDGEDDDLREVLARTAGRHHRIDLFDATGDIGVPTVYAVERAAHHPRVATVVMCATDPDPARAAVKVIKEAVACRTAIEAAAEATHPLVDPADCTSVLDGALYMAVPERAHAFRFLDPTRRPRPLTSLADCTRDTPAATLAGIVERLDKLGFEAFVVDLTSDEAREAGFWVVKAIVPALQPLSFVARAQYRGHPRLYRAPVAMGFRSLPESHLNPFPQPIA
jgi:ribosomal protein S12 methylthiotransferase accessory factor